MDCNIRLAQIDTTLGNLAANLRAHLELVDDAVRDRIDILVFPELSMTGYFLKDQTAEVARPVDGPELAALARRSEDVTIVVGFVELGRDGQVYNATAVLEDGKLLHVHRKVHLVTYGMFEESRDLASGDTFASFESKHGRFGILTCEDMWHVGGGYLYFLDGVDAILVNSAGPGRGVTGDKPELSSTHTWHTILDASAFWFRTWILYANRVGWEDGILFGGGTRAVDPEGTEVGELAGVDPGVLDVHVTSRALIRSRLATPLRRDEKPWLLARELVRRAGLELPRGEGSEDE